MDRHPWLDAALAMSFVALGMFGLGWSWLVGILIGFRNLIFHDGHDPHNGNEAVQIEQMFGQAVAAFITIVIVLCAFFFHSQELAFILVGVYFIQGIVINLTGGLIFSYLNRKYRKEELDEYAEAVKRGAKSTIKSLLRKEDYNEVERILQEILEHDEFNLSLLYVYLDATAPAKEHLPTRKLIIEKLIKGK